MRAIRLFDEARDLEGAGDTAQRWAALDIAVPGPGRLAVMPKVTRRPVPAAAAARATAASNAAVSVIAWSDGITSISASGALAASVNAATQQAGYCGRPARG